MEEVFNQNLVLHVLTLRNRGKLLQKTDDSEHPDDPQNFEWVEPHNALTRHQAGYGGKEIADEVSP